MHVGKRVTVTGAPVVASSLGAEIEREVPRLGLAALFAVAVAFLATYRVRGWRRLVPLGLGLASTAITMGCLAVIGVPFSLGMLTFLPVMLGVGTDFPVQTSYPSRRRTLLAAAVASTAGFLALLLSPVPFVRHLGVALALGIVVSTGAGLAARRLGLLISTGADRGTAGADTAFGSWPGLGGRRRWTIVPAALLALAGWALLPSLPVESRPERLAAGLPSLGDARRAERVVGASGEVSVRVRADDVLRPDLLAWFGQAEEELVLRFGDRLRPIVSPVRLLSWIGPDATPDQIDAALRLLPRYLVGASIRSDRKEAVSAFGLRLGDFKRQHELLRGLKAALPPAPPGARVDVTGLPMVGGRGYELLSDRRLAASLAGPFLTGIVLVLLLRPRKDGLIAVMAALLAVGWGVLVLKLTGAGLSPLTVGLGSLTAAVGAEFSVFALDRVRLGVARPWSGVVAAAATSAAGFAALGLSRLAALRQFGLLLAGSVLLALLAARLLIGQATPKEPSPGPNRRTINTGARRSRRMSQSPGEKEGAVENGDERIAEGAAGKRRRSRTARVLVPVVILVAAISAGGLALAARDTCPSSGAALEVRGRTVKEDELERRVELLSALYGVKPPPESDGKAIDAFRRDTAKAVAVSLIVERGSQQAQPHGGRQGRPRCARPLHCPDLPAGRPRRIRQRTVGTRTLGDRRIGRISSAPRDAAALRRLHRQDQRDRRGGHRRVPEAPSGTGRP